jgi:hypothetical protein
MSEQPSEKKIIVDEDWKTRVEAEREATRNQGEAEPEKPAAKPEAAEPEPDRPMPPADLMFIATTMYMQALVALGLVPDPIVGKPRVRLHQARHAIDSLEVLRAKTEGNRTPEETEGIDAMLHEMRMAFVARG